MAIIFFASILIFTVLWVNNKSPITKESPVESYLQSSLPIYKKDDLWWGRIPFNGGEFEMIIDTGSSTISLASDICSTCFGPPFIQNKGQKSTQSVSYGGGQKMEYYIETVNSPILGANIQASIVTSGANPQGKVYNILGLLNRSLALKTLMIDFPNKNMEFNGPKPVNFTGSPSPIKDNIFITVDVTGSDEISSVIIDSGTNYVLTDAYFPNGFSFYLGDTEIYIPSNIIHKNVASGNSKRIILGNYILDKYKWYFDFDKNLVWVSK